MLVTYFKKQSGFTLLEGIFAIAVITIGLMVGLTLAISNLYATLDNERRIIAASLAREGIEVVRNARDTNWMRIQNNETQSSGSFYFFDTLLDDSGDPLGDYLLLDHDFNLSAGTVNFNLRDATAQTMDSCVASEECRVSFDEGSAHYGLTSASDDSEYFRLITIQVICWETSTGSADERDYVMDPGITCNAGDRQSGIMVTSHVRYVTNTNHDIIVRERLYDWR